MGKQTKKQKTEDPVIAAIKNGNLEYVQNVIEKGSFSLSPTWLEGYNLLRTAIECRNNEIASWLISKDCRINRIDDNDTTNTPLHLAIYYDENSVAAELLEKGVCKNVKNGKGETPLHVSISKKNIGITSLLLRDSSIVNVPDNFLNTPLHMAVASECLETIQLLLNHKVDVDVHTINQIYPGFMPLHIAILKENEEIVKMLLQYGADVQAVIKYEKSEFLDKVPFSKYRYYTALHLAIEMNNINIVRLLLEHGANVNAAIESTGKTSLHTAIHSQHIKIFVLLLEYKADFHAKTKTGKNVLHLAVENNWPTLAATILATGLSIDEQTDDGETPIHIAVKLGYHIMITMLITHKANVNIRNSKSQIPLHYAAAFDSKTVDILLHNESMVDAVDDNDETPLSIAVKNNNVDIVRQILKFKPNINSKCNNSALAYIVKKSDCSYLNVINLMLEYGFKLNIEDIKGTDLLYNSVSQGYIEIVRYLLEKLHIFQHDSENLKNKLSLHKAVLNQNFDMVQLLISHGCDINIADDSGITPLGYSIEKSNNLKILDFLLKSGATFENDAYPMLRAAKDDDILLIQLLLNHGANVSISDEFGTTALHFATWNTHFRFVKFLLHNGACVNTTEDSNVKILANSEEHDSYTKEFKRRVFTSPLHIAVSKKCPLLCVTLLEYHASVNCKDGHGRTPLHIASAIKSTEQKNIIEKLLGYGADINALDDFKRLPIYYIYNQTCMCSIAFQNQYEVYNECECHLGDDYDINNVIAVFIKHIAFLTSINKYIHEDNLKIVSSSDTLRDLYDSCLLEITKMKEEKVMNFISFYDVLSKKTNALALCFHNEDVIEAFKSSDYKNKFPLYSDRLLRQYNIAKARKCLLDSAVISFNKILKFNLPEVISGKIFEYLHLNDLNNLSNAGVNRTREISTASSQKQREVEFNRDYSILKQKCQKQLTSFSIEKPTHLTKKMRYKP